MCFLMQTRSRRKEIGRGQEICCCVMQIRGPKHWGAAISVLGVHGMRIRLMRCDVRARWHPRLCRHTARQIASGCVNATAEACGRLQTRPEAGLLFRPGELDCVTKPSQMLPSRQRWLLEALLRLREV